jgi:hypothetical protein
VPRHVVIVLVIVLVLDSVRALHIKTPRRLHASPGSWILAPSSCSTRSSNKSDLCRLSTDQLSCGSMSRNEKYFYGCELVSCSP